jgi:hypothetical protein
MERPAPASSSRRSVVELLVVVAGLGATGLLSVAACRGGDANRGPRLRVHEGSKPAPGTAEPPALWLALATLDATRRAALLDDLEAALSSAEARANPLLVDLMDDDPGAVLRRNGPWLLPLCSAANALLAGRYEAPDGFAVEVLPVHAPVERGDLPAWGPLPHDERARRARFLAWPASRCLLVEARTREVREAIESDLRQAAAEASSALALVITRTHCRGQSDDPRLAHVLSRLARASRAAPDANSPLVLTMPAGTDGLLPWVSLSDTDLLVVPKLGGLSPSARFASEVRARIRPHDASIVGAEA